MDRVLNFNDILIGFNSHLNANLRLDENGLCSIKHEDGLIIILEVPKGSDSFYLYAPLATVPNDLVSAYRLFGRALKLNMFQVKTEGGAVAYSEDLQQIMLMLASPIKNCTSEVLLSIISNFINSGLKLKRELELESSKEIIN